MPEDIHPEAKRLLEDSGYLWDACMFAFRRKRRVGIESTEEYRADPAIISYAELSDHGLASRPNSKAGTMKIKVVVREAEERGY